MFRAKEMLGTEKKKIKYKKKKKKKKNEKATETVRKERRGTTRNVDICSEKAEMEKDKLAFPKWGKLFWKFIFSINVRGCGGISDDPYQTFDKNELYYKISVFFDIFRFSPLTP